MEIPRCMSTQHPDNAKQPFFAENSVLNGNEEIKEAYYAYSHFNCTEQLWDCEGKEVDSFVIKKLFDKYGSFFKGKKLGEDLFLTLRVPNPSVEKVEAKVLLETLESIPRSSDAARIFYEEDTIPIFEISVPMVTSASELTRISEYYKKIVVGKQYRVLADMKIKDWIGKFQPDSIRIIPLIETKEAMLDSTEIVREFITKNKVEDYIRVWLARSDPALNYSSLAAVLINKISLQRLHMLEQEESIKVFPIIGCGSAPFRGNLTPANVDELISGYSSVQTFTLQSAFKYDYPVEDVKSAVEKINNTKRKEPIDVEEERCLRIIERLSDAYTKQVMLVAPLVNELVKFVPKRRMRKLHIGLFGYSRDKGNIQLPRAIGFCASLYSAGLPPEILGLSALQSKDLECLESVYKSFRSDTQDALKYLNKDNFKYFPKHLINQVNKSLELFNFEIDEDHKSITREIMESTRLGKTSLVSEKVLEAAMIRRFLG